MESHKLSELEIGDTITIEQKQYEITRIKEELARDGDELEQYTVFELHPAHDQSISTKEYLIWHPKRHTLKLQRDIAAEKIIAKH